MRTHSGQPFEISRHKRHTQRRLLTFMARWATSPSSRLGRENEHTSHNTLSARKTGLQPALFNVTTYSLTSHTHARPDPGWSKLINSSVQAMHRALLWFPGQQHTRGIIEKRSRKYNLMWHYGYTIFAPSVSFTGRYTVWRNGISMRFFCCCCFPSSIHLFCPPHSKPFLRCCCWCCCS